MAMIPGNLTASRLPTLGNAATIGNPQGQAAAVQELARLLAQYQQAQAGVERGQQLQETAFVPNSGALGFLAQVASSYKGGKLKKAEGEKAADFTQRILEAQ